MVVLLLRKSGKMMVTHNAVKTWHIWLVLDRIWLMRFAERSKQKPQTKLAASPVDQNDATRLQNCQLWPIFLLKWLAQVRVIQHCLAIQNTWIYNFYETYWVRSNEIVFWDEILFRICTRSLACRLIDGRGRLWDGGDWVKRLRGGDLEW